MQESSESIGILRDFLPLIGVFVGASVVHFGNLHLQKKKQRDEYTRFKREKLEHIYLLSHRIYMLVSTIFTSCLNHLVQGKHLELDAHKVKDSPIGELSMLVSFYFPEMNEQARAFTKAAEDNFISVSKAFVAEAAKGDKKSIEAFTLIALKQMEAIEVIYRELEESIITTSESLAFP